jgi:hypothetical protein
MEKLKEISEIDEALEITGKYIGGLVGYETFPEERHKKENDNQTPSSISSSSSSEQDFIITIRQLLQQLQG